MAYELIITEKPAAANKVASALADGKPIKKNEKGVPYYEITHGKKDIVVACAVGHLYGLTQKADKKKQIPIFEVEWKPVSETSKTAKFSKKYLDVIKKLCKGASEITVATDYDIEGEVIGLNIVRFACKKKDAKRMKFSTLTKSDLIKAYDAAAKHLDWGQANAGETRHKLDWFYGINTSRALMRAIKKAGMFKLMSTGRVQGPALKFIVEREKEIAKFKPVPYWQLELQGKVDKNKIIAWHEKDKFWKKEEAQDALKKTKGNDGVVDKVERSRLNQMPPHPFDLTSLQVESHKCLNISPKETLAIAQELYTSGYISYPRTSSQQLPPGIGFKKILQSLAKQSNYKVECDSLLKKQNLNPNNGKKTDPAHPAIYPTGIPPKKIKPRDAKVYDLIVRRFLATFGEHAVRETMKAFIDVNKEVFIAKGTRTVEKGWHVYYGKYTMLKEEELPNVSKGQTVHVDKIIMHDKETQPPKRFTESSIIKELERRNLGTKATRAAIIDTLFNRGYVEGKPIKATELGIKTSDTLSKYSPTIVDEELTRSFEEEMDKIRDGKSKVDSVIQRAESAVKKIVEEFKEHETKIGKNLMDAQIETRDEMSMVGKCPVCSQGELHIRTGKFGRFIACNRYPDCKTTFGLPKGGLIKGADKVCEHCGFPLILVIKRGKRPQEVCFNQDCPSKKLDHEAKKEVKQIESGKLEKKCPKCGADMVVRSSIYGKFLGCSKYPKCRHTEKL
ncbi:DNA topoisomerase I [Candidatus Woesearchaeota archaeon]|nr:DNA topoisomerase I [Candidatus Woesearchaeota archaeon]